MEYFVSNRIKDVKASFIRELFKMANNPNLISFGGGNPSPDTFPSKEIAEITAKVLAENPTSVLQYGLSEGYIPLRETMKKYLAEKEHIDFEKNDLYIVSGAQQGMDLSCKIFVNEGDTVISENPAFIGCLNAIRSYAPNLVGVNMQEDGMDIDMLEKTLKENKNARLIYTIPSFQNPTGFSTSLEKRKEIYRLAQKYDVIIYEDDPYGELSFSGNKIPTIKSMDTDGRVIYVGSFSKTIAPAIRLGFMVFDKALATRITVAKQVTDVHSNVLFQYVCNEYITKYDYQAHLKETSALYYKKCNLMIDEMKKKFSPKVKFNIPDGGLFVMAFLPEGYDSFPFVQEGIKRNVATIPGAAFSVDETQIQNGFRLNYSTPTDENIIKGIDILGKLTYEWLK